MFEVSTYIIHYHLSYSRFLHFMHLMHMIFISYIEYARLKVGFHRSRFPTSIFMYLYIFPFSLILTTISIFTAKGSALFRAI